MWTAGNLRIQISKVLNVEAEKRGDLGKTEDMEEIRDLGRTGEVEKREERLESTERVILMNNNKILSKFLKV